jgi:hypothetical protein
VCLAPFPDEIAAKLPQPGATQAVLVQGKLEGVASGMTLGSPHSAAEACFFDLDTGRQMKWPGTLPASEKIDEHDPALVKWAAEEGIDLMGVERPLPGSSQMIYALRTFGTKAWRIEGGRKAIDRQLQARKPLSLDKPAGDFLVPDGKPTGDDSSTTFLLITREGATAVVSLSQVGVPSRTPGGPKRVPWRDGAEFDYALVCDNQSQEGSASDSQPLMFSVGVNSDAGLIGTVVLTEPQELPRVVGNISATLYPLGGSPPVAYGRALDSIRLRSGDPIDEKKLAQTAADVERTLTNLGCLDAKVEHQTGVPALAKDHKLGVPVGYKIFPGKLYPVRIEWVRGQAGSLLERQVAVEISEARLPDVVRSLRALLDVPVLLEEPLAEHPADLERPVTLRAHSIRLDSFLAALLEPYGLQYELGADGLVLWHPQYSAMKTVRYPIADILAPPEPDSGAAINAKEVATLTEFITTTVAPTSWSTVDGRGLIEATDSSELIVTQTREVHREIRGVLSQLRSQQGAPRGKQVPLDFDHEPLGKILDWLYAEHQVNVQVDHRALREAGCDLNTPIAVHIHDLPLEPALEAMLEPLELDCRFENGLVRIDRIQTLAVCYNVADLLNTTLQGQPPTSGRLSFDTLIEHIKTEVLPKSWEDRGGRASISPFETNLSLVVSQTQKGHQQLTELLDNLRHEEDARLQQGAREPAPKRESDSSLRSE